jgi:hypothetical protein
MIISAIIINRVILNSASGTLVKQAKNKNKVNVDKDLGKLFFLKNKIIT